jgi:serine/threonine protein kinase
MRQLGKHAHIVQLVDVYEHAVLDGCRNVGTEVYLLMELCSGGSLADAMKQRQGRALPEKQMWSMFLYPSPPTHTKYKYGAVLQI